MHLHLETRMHGCKSGVHDELQFSMSYRSGHWAMVLLEPQRLHVSQPPEVASSLAHQVTHILQAEHASSARRRLL